MKTLDDKIIARLTSGSYTEGLYITYYVSTTTSTDNAFYVGKAYKMAFNSGVDVCLNDILENRKQYSNFTSISNMKWLKLKIYVIWYDGETKNTKEIEVLLIHNYPFKDYDVAVYDVSTAMVNINEGVNLNLSDITESTMDLYPTYPSVYDPSVFVPKTVFRETEDISGGLFYGFNDKDYTVNTSCGMFNDFVYIESIYAKPVGSFSHLDCDHNSIGVHIDQYGDHIIADGLRMWKVKVEGLNLLLNDDYLDFVELLGYDQYYAEHFFIQYQSFEQIYFIVETNDPSTDIDDEWNGRSLDLHFDMSYERVSSCSNYTIQYEIMNNVTGYRAWVPFVSFMGDVCPWIDEAFLKDEMGLEYGEPITSSYVAIKTPYLVPDGQLIKVDGDASAGFMGYFEHFESSIGSRSYKYDDFFYQGDEGLVTDPKLETYSEERYPKILKIGNIDCCPAHYYLQWYDRFGGIQCLPFDKKETKTIDYTQTTIENQFGERRLVVSQNTQKFVINSDYINDIEMPIYESIFVSPYLLLYDTVTNKAYNVIIIDKTFTEKTFKNQGKKMYNLTLTLEINKNENIIY